MTTIRNPRRGTFRDDPRHWKQPIFVADMRPSGHAGRVVTGGLRTRRRVSRGGTGATQGNVAELARFLLGLTATEKNMLRWQVPRELALYSTCPADTLVNGVQAGSRWFRLTAEPVPIHALPVVRRGDDFCWRVAA